MGVALRDREPSIGSGGQDRVKIGPIGLDIV
jgi:hypothetical protein